MSVDKVIAAIGAAIVAAFVAVLIKAADLYTKSRDAVKAELERAAESNAAVEEARVRARNDPDIVTQLFLRMGALEQTHAKEIAELHLQADVDRKLVEEDRRSRAEQELKCQEQVRQLQTLTNDQGYKIEELEATLSEMEAKVKKYKDILAK